jgi:hypothetical protein
MRFTWDKSVLLQGDVVEAIKNLALVTKNSNIL